MLKTIRIDKLDLGTVPPRVDCFKSFETGEDELIIEASSCLPIPRLAQPVGRRALLVKRTMSMLGLVRCLPPEPRVLERQGLAEEMGAIYMWELFTRGCTLLSLTPWSPHHPVQTPAFWGGDISLRVTAVVQAGSKTVDVPVDVSNIQASQSPSWEVMRGVCTLSRCRAPRAPACNCISVC